MNHCLDVISLLSCSSNHYYYIIRLFNIGQNADALQYRICYNTRMQINKMN